MNHRSSGKRYKRLEQTFILNIVDSITTEIMLKYFTKPLSNNGCNLTHDLQFINEMIKHLFIKYLSNLLLKKISSSLKFNYFAKSYQQLDVVSTQNKYYSAQEFNAKNKCIFRSKWVYYDDYKKQ